MDPGIFHILSLNYFKIIKYFEIYFYDKQNN